MLGIELSSTKNTGFSTTSYLRDRGKSFATVPAVRINPYGGAIYENELMKKFTRKITDRKTNQMGGVFDVKLCLRWTLRCEF